MKILPLDIKQQQFPKVLRGYSPSEVHAFLDLLAHQYEEVVRENNDLKDEMKKAQADLQTFRERETTLKDTMLTAQKLSDEMKMAAKKEAELLLQEAELKGERLVTDAHQKMIKIMDQIQDLRLERARMISSFQALLQHHLRLVEASAQEASQEPDVNLAFLKPGRARQGD